VITDAGAIDNKYIDSHRCIQHVVSQNNRLYTYIYVDSIYYYITDVHTQNNSGVHTYVRPRLLSMAVGRGPGASVVNGNHEPVLTPSTTT